MIHRNIDDYLVDLSACIDSETIPDTFEDYLKDRENNFRFTASILFDS
ncbi:hypothetical protein [Enterococcus faecalis]|nr:hypothetical protein [Enterococcus faecalis]